MMIFPGMSQKDWLEYVRGKAFPEVEEKIRKKAKEIGYPIFTRTDHASNKFEWNRSSFITKEEDLGTHIRRMVEFSFLADIMGLPINAIVFREYIPMDELFTAYLGEMPVNPEIRFFIRDGKVQCKHFYWIPEAIVEGTPKGKLISNWKKLLEDTIKSITKQELDILTKYTELVARKFDGYWSVDFCRAKDKRWILIDMAEGDISWHPECPKNKQEGL
jgi:hypothetical protein